MSSEVDKPVMPAASGGVSAVLVEESSTLSLATSVVFIGSVSFVASAGTSKLSTVSTLPGNMTKFKVSLDKIPSNLSDTTTSFPFFIHTLTSNSLSFKEIT